MTTTTTHHPSCPVRQHQHTLDCPMTTVERSDATWDSIRSVEFDCQPACLCGPEAAAEDQLILQHRTADEAVLDVFTHVAQAMTDWTDNAHRRGGPKGLLSCVLLDNEQLGTDNIKGSFGVKA